MLTLFFVIRDAVHLNMTNLLVARNDAQFPEEPRAFKTPRLYLELGRQNGRRTLKITQSLQMPPGLEF